MPEAPAGRVSIECKLSRLEVSDHGDMEVDGALQRWRLTAGVLDENADGRGLGLMLGTLLATDGTTWGQALVRGLVSRDRPFPSYASFKNFINTYGVGMVEEMYDVARRALNVNLAMLDCDLDIPSAAPHADFRFLRPEDLADDENGDGGDPADD